MPSLVHEIFSRAIPVVRRSAEVVDPERTRREVLDGQSGAVEAPPTGRGRLRGVTLTRRSGAPFPVHEVRPEGSTPTRTVLHLHGGGFVGGLDRFHWRFAAGLARDTGTRWVLPAYPLTPTHSWRDALEPLTALFTELAVESPGGVVLAGDSAGGGLALALAQRIARSPGPQPTGLVLVSPWVDLTGTTPGTEEAAARDPWLRLSKLKLFGSWWAGGDDPLRPEVSPLFGDHTGLPRTLVLCGTRDLLLPQVREAVRRARAAGVEVSYEEEPGLIHVYPLLPVREGRAARRRIAAFLGGPVVAG
ncbi:alpha/beta hydrolase fold domain-containing protein [Nocardioides mesophilus]|uniref:Alpha/beta hydrolase fold domain-containing protein n=1 Tax=Nocardioides mesophilus TaxID=433659 RepID=A0A7G9R6G7_9ACTN|nr:alpha/beta hydrolase [Nocardioides mesophilus]QNN51192.1 alpha/beta hydrolase fold domain-containing protein [Nocardioides mesophilus]